jgi:hypothetical protein
MIMKKPSSVAITISGRANASKLSGTASGPISALAPVTAKALKTFEPSTLPTASSG